MIDDVLSLVVLAVLKNLEGSVSVWHVFRPIVASIGATIVGVVFKALLNKYVSQPLRFFAYTLALTFARTTRSPQCLHTVLPLLCTHELRQAFVLHILW